MKILKNIIYALMLSVVFLGWVHITKSYGNTLDHVANTEFTRTVIDTICTHKFYKASKEFLNPDRAVINSYDEDLVPCCMKLIANGDTTAKNILYERISKRIEKFRQNEMGYITISKIIPETLGKLPERRSLELCMLLFEYSEVLEFGGQCYQLGYSVFRDAIMNIISLEKAEEYDNLAALKYREAIALGLHDCGPQAYVVSYLYPIVKSDMIKGELKLRESQKE